MPAAYNRFYDNVCMFDSDPATCMIHASAGRARVPLARMLPCAVCTICTRLTSAVLITLCVSVVTVSTLVLNGYWCHDACDDDVVNDDAYAGNDYDCNGEGYVR